MAGEAGYFAERCVIGPGPRPLGHVLKLQLFTSDEYYKNAIIVPFAVLHPTVALAYSQLVKA